MNDKLVNVIDIDGKDFFLIDVIDKYNFFAEVNNSANICILKEDIIDGEEYLINLERFEVDKALMLFYKKHEKYNNIND